MQKIIRAGERYHFENDWLSTYWHFSFDHYYDPANVSFGPLRVFNDDVIRPGGGFPMHEHREMEIVTYMLDGQLEHRDSLGNVGRIGPGEIQRMSAGTGIRHSEHNPSKQNPVHLLQLWIQPTVQGLKPSWEQRRFDPAERAGRLCAVVVPAAGTPDAGTNGPVRIHQDATIYTSLLRPGESLEHTLARDRRAYLFVIAGELQVNKESLQAGDQARISDERALHLSVPTGRAQADFLLLDLP